MYFNRKFVYTTVSCCEFDLNSIYKTVKMKMVKFFIINTIVESEKKQFTPRIAHFLYAKINVNIVIMITKRSG